VYQAAQDAAATGPRGRKRGASGADAPVVADKGESHVSHVAAAVAACVLLLCYYVIVLPGSNPVHSPPQAPVL
jgi:hypothetical protein